MAKKKEKRPKKKESAGPRDAVRGAVESTFQRAAGGASKAQELLDEIAGNVKALREANLIETLESVRDEVQSLAKRVAALELRAEEQSAPAKPAPRRATAGAARGTAAKKPAAAKTTGTRSTARKPAGSATSKPATTTARKPAGTTTRRPATPRASSTARKPSPATPKADS